LEAGVEITKTDRALFGMRRFYNRTLGTHVLGWSHDRLTIFGYSIMSKHAVDALYSKQASENLKAGLSADEYREVCQVLAMIRVLPRPDLTDGSFSDRQKAEYGIRLVWNRLYIFRT
jgi:hypothetical protein